MNQPLFHYSFVFVFVAFAAIRAVYHPRARQAQGKVDLKDGKLHIALRKLLGIPFILATLAFMIRPSLLGSAQFEAPVWLQWAGLGLGLASLPLIWWVHWALGANFSTLLHLREEHTLVTHGPYRWVRHPMYTVLFVHGLSALLLTCNWLIGGVYLLGIAVIVSTRVNREEATMTEKFGAVYQQYMALTGRFLPRIMA